MFACSNYACALSPFEKALCAGALGGLAAIAYSIFFVVLFGLLVKAFGAFGYIFGMMLLIFSIYL
jgi:hypothetical protein